MKFLTDGNLGKLTKWLRILGYDTVVYRGAIDRHFLRHGLQEGRVVLTRRRDMAARNFLGTMYVVMSDHVPSQLHELINNLSLDIDPGRFLSICLECNEKIASIEKNKIADRLPSMISRYYNEFYICPNCKRIYWQGAHYENILTLVRQIKK